MRDTLTRHALAHSVYRSTLNAEGALNKERRVSKASGATDSLSRVPVTGKLAAVRSVRPMSAPAVLSTSGGF